MAAPDLTKRAMVAVAQIGTDDNGYNIVGAPQARLTIAKALGDLATTYEAATPTAPKTISIEPGTYITPAFALPPNVFIEADPDAQGGSDSEVIILLTGNVTLDPTWAINTTAVGGFRGVTFRKSTSQVIDLTLPTPLSGNPTRTITLNDVRSDALISYEATSTADACNIKDLIYDGANSGSLEFSGGAITVRGLVSSTAVLFNDTAAIAAAVNASGIYTVAAPGATSPGVTFASSTGGVTARMGFCDNRALTLNRAGAAAITVYADAVSIPLVANITFLGTATNADLIRTTDTGAIAGGNITADGSATNAGGNTTITPTGRVYSFTLTVTTNDGTTRIGILSTAGAPAPAAGDLILLNVIATGLTSGTLELRSATAGGPLLTSLLFADATAAFFALKFDGAAWVSQWGEAPLVTTPLPVNVQKGGAAGVNTITADLIFPVTRELDLNARVYYPLLTQVSIQAAATAAAAAGGGIVKIPAGTLALTSAFTLLAGVIFEGSGTAWDSQSNAYTAGVGTILTGNGTFNAFEFNPTDNPNPAAGGNPTPLSLCVRGAGVRNLTLSGFSYGVKVGALNSSGMTPVIMDTLTITLCAQWGFWLENSQSGSVRNIACLQNTVGQFCISGSTPAWNMGNMDVRNIYCQGPIGVAASLTARNLVIQGRNTSTLNALTMGEIESLGGNVGGASTYTAAVTITNLSANIAVLDLTKFALGSPVRFSATTGNLAIATTYFVVSKSAASGAGNIQVASGIGDSAITATANGTPNITTAGPALIEIAGNGTSAAVTGTNIVGVDLEVPGTVTLLLQRAAYSNILLGLVTNSTAGICVRSSFADNYVQCGQTMARDIDFGSRQIRIDGLDAGTSTGNFPGVGIRSNNTQSTLWLQGNGLGTMTQNPNNYALHIAPAAFTRGLIATGSNYGNTANGNICVYNTTADGTNDLPTIDANNAGVVFFITNPTAFICTVNTGGAQLINAQAGVTSFTVGPKSTRIAIAINGLTFYWAVNGTTTIAGSATNDSAIAGNIGEYLTALIASGAAVALTTATPANVTSLALTAGDWDVWGVIDYVLTGVTGTNFKSGSSTTSATFGTQDTFAIIPLITTALTDTFSHLIPMQRISLAAAGTAYLVAQETFSVGSSAAYGTIFARRRR